MLIGTSRYSCKDTKQGIQLTKAVRNNLSHKQLPFKHSISRCGDLEAIIIIVTRNMVCISMEMYRNEIYCFFTQFPHN